MKSREIVKRAIHFQDPPRLPYNFDSNRTPEDGISYGEDMIWVSAAKRTLTDGKNEWGVEYETLDDVSFGEPKVFPLAGKESLEDYVFPDFSEDWRYEELRRTVRENNGEKYVLGMLPTGLFQHMIDLFGFNDFLINVGINPDFVGEVCDRLLAIDQTVAEKMAACGVDGILTLDDAALQDRLMISMEAFNTIFKPRFARLYEHCHALGMDTFIHSCGYTIDIIEEWIDAGCDVINLDQQDNMGIDELARRYRGRICFYCPLDIQRTVGMEKEEITARVKQMVEAFTNGHGGLIAKTYPQPRAVGMTDEYLKTMTDAFKKY